MPKHYKGRKARKNPIEKAVESFKRDGKNKICKEKIRCIMFLADSFMIDPPNHQARDQIEIFDTAHCSKYVDNIAIFAEAADRMLTGNDRSLAALMIEFQFTELSDQMFHLEFDIPASTREVFAKLIVHDLTLFTNKGHLAVFLVDLANQLGLPPTIGTRYKDQYKREISTMRVNIDKYIRWSDSAMFRLSQNRRTINAETEQAQSDIELADNVLSDSRSSEDQDAIADAMKESAEATLTTNAINHPENKKVVDAALENVPGEQLSLFLDEAQEELEDIEQQNAQAQSSSASRQEKEESEELAEESAADFLELRQRHLERLARTQQVFAQTPPPPPQAQVQTPPPPVKKSSGKEVFSFNQDNFEMTPAVRVGSGNNKNLEKIAKSLRNRLAEFIDYESIDGVIFYNVVLGNKTSADVNGDVVTVTVTKTSSIEDAIEALAYAIVPLFEENSFKFNMDGYLLTDTLIHVYDYA